MLVSPCGYKIINRAHYEGLDESSEGSRAEKPEISLRILTGDVKINK